jgi:uncharacterized metal-binding protein
MDCLVCKTKTCRTGTACKAGTINIEDITNEYYKPENQQVVQNAAILVDHGRAGTLSRLEEIVEFARLMNYSKIGMAYCYGMETEAKLVANYLRNNDLKPVPVSCTTGGISQRDVNKQSLIDKVSCNPIAQAMQLNSANIDLTITMGLCMGHDILFNRYIDSDVTNLIVKDRLYKHNPLECVIKLKN